ncbi:PREDICTED: unknown protein 1 [Nelumbo nucifera]|uniref:Uncharacterized protein n=2 Tax=Nelumbo nucifera TaxID=4432 RepID=A0A1U8BC00_NELNU|nr:PREDICTED: unknown protein 1 [Nelumbo nucifera]XP_010278925.1 PREDICTED: unknown protein 1 [Nelumbo nucifera]DAD38543.1 TPA_asm: hypothetical protein HUJ06_012865 [Nelumbo nucifera]
MESEASLEKTRVEGDSPKEALQQKKATVVESEDGKQLEETESSATLGPTTPVPDRENGEVVLDFKSPLTWVSSPPVAVCVDSAAIDEVSGSDVSPRTPKRDVFDPFAPGPDELMLAPRGNKYLEESRNKVARRLNFVSSVESMAFSEEGDDGVEAELQQEALLESVCKLFWEVIVSNQVEEVVDETLHLESNRDGLKTPTLLPHLNGVAETCPGAPVKPTRKFRNIDPGLCRKLEF